MAFTVYMGPRKKDFTGALLPAFEQRLPRSSLAVGASLRDDHLRQVRIFATADGVHVAN